MVEQKTKEWLSKEFDIPADEIVFYNSGICYSRIGVTSKESANKVTDKVTQQGRTANGGYFHGMPLGGQSYYKRNDGSGYYDVMI